MFNTYLTCIDPQKVDLLRMIRHGSEERRIMNIPIKAMDTINQTIGLYWDIHSGQRAAMVNIYGDDDLITEESRADAILIASSVPASSGEYMIDSELDPADV